MYLTDRQEDRVVRFILAMSKIGKGFSKQELPGIVKSVLDRAEKDGLIDQDARKFKDNLPSNGWIYSFMKRHPIVSSRIPENLGFQRAHINEEGVRKWFAELEKYLAEEHSINAAEFFTEENRCRIFNWDESGFPLQGTAGKCKILAERGAKNVHRLAPDNKQQITVLASVSADGAFNTPFVLFPGKKLPKFNLTGVNEDDFHLGYSPNGWMSSDAFFGWLTNLFFPAIKEKVRFPIIAFMDGHSAHINIAVSDFCRDNGIILYCFPAHASHALQPLDVSVFGPMKRSWNKHVQDFHSKNRIPMTKAHFFPVFDAVWKEACRKPDNVKSGFRATGLVPFNVENVDFSKLLDYSAIAKFKLREPRPDELLAGERVGLLRALDIVESELDDGTLNLFKERYNEDFDVNDEDGENGKLWRIFRNIKKCLSSNANSDDRVALPEVSHQSAGNATVTNVNDNSYVSETESEVSVTGNASASTSNTANTSVPGCSHAQANIHAPHAHNHPSSIELVSILPNSLSTTAVTMTPSTSFQAENVKVTTISSIDAGLPFTPPRNSNVAASTSQSLHLPNSNCASINPSENDVQSVSDSSFLNSSMSSYKNFPISPFKTYLDISEDVVIARKTTSKPKIPYAISGSDYNKTLKINQEKKKKEEDAKQQRREKRLMKKNANSKSKATAKKSVKRTNRQLVSDHEDSTEDEPDIVQYDDSDDSVLMEELTVREYCLACEGREKWGDGKAWIGCNKCTGWLHRRCVSQEVESMTEAQIKRFTFTCFACSKTQEKKTKASI